MVRFKHTFIRITILLTAALAACDPPLQSGPSSDIQNPVLPGFYPDPSICRVDSDFYLVNSSFSWFPGIPIFHSRDLVNWKQIGHVLQRPSQLNLDSLGVSEGIFAPTIRYHKGVYYVITTLVGQGGNFFVTATHPAGPWSEPVWLPEINGIDPSIFFDDNDSCYIVNNGPPPNNTPLYDGHRAIWMQAFNIHTFKLTGKRRIIINGGSNMTQHPVWIEGPHIFKKAGFYYLSAAEGGTGINHSQVIFRSKSVWGPWESYADNPILSQRSLPADRSEPITCTGHADMFQTAAGEWWAVFLGCQPYAPFEKNFYNTGRETFMAPVRWSNGWPVIGEQTKALKRSYTQPNLPTYKRDGYEQINQKLNISNNFDSTQLSPQWNMLRTPHKQWYKLQEGQLIIDARQVKLSGKGNPSMMARRQQHAYCTATSYFYPNAIDKQLQCGLVAFQNDQHFYALELLQNKETAVVRVRKVDQILAVHPVSPATIKESMVFRITARGRYYDFDFRQTSGDWQPLLHGVDGTFLSTEVAGGFVGTYLGMYAIGENQKVTFDRFEYKASPQ